MRLTYSSILNAHFRNIGEAAHITDTTLLADFNYNLGTRYQTIWAALAEYINSQTFTDTTVAGQQYYNNPVGNQSLDEVTITIGSVQYPLSTIYSQHSWNQLNAMQIQPSAIPQFLFPRQLDYGIWPIPQAPYTITINAFQRDRDLSVIDYSNGTVSLTNGDATVTGSGTIFTPAMVGRWFTITDTSVPGQGYWYKIVTYTSATSIELNQPWNAADAAGKSFLIGESPQLPEEAHILLPVGTAADFYMGLRNDSVKATWFNNVFWTGDGNNNIRDFGNSNVAGGLIGLWNRYQGRDRKSLIQRQPNVGSPTWKIWAETIS